MFNETKKNFDIQVIATDLENEWNEYQKEQLSLKV